MDRARTRLLALAALALAAIALLAACGGSDDEAAAPADPRDDGGDATGERRLRGRARGREGLPARAHGAARRASRREFQSGRAQYYELAEAAGFDYETLWARTADRGRAARSSR